MANVTAKNLDEHMTRCIEPSARIMTDELNAYTKIGRKFASHEKVMHSAEEYVRGDVTTNTVEGFFSILKRGLN